MWKQKINDKHKMKIKNSIPQHISYSALNTHLISVNIILNILKLFCYSKIDIVKK